MSAPKRTKAQREADLVLIQDWYVRGDSQRTIAERLGDLRAYRVSHQTICNDIEAILERWRQATVQNIDELKAQELAKINTIEREAWRAWERSIGKSERTLAEKRTGDIVGERSQIIRETLIGDPRFLEKIQWCINKRCEILGLNAPAKLEHTGKDGRPIEMEARAVHDLSKLSDDEIEQWERLCAKAAAGERDTGG